MKGGDKMRNKKGFTLIELLVVIAIIAILSAIGLVALNGAREKARDAQRRSDVAQIRTALNLFYDDYNGYPGTTTINAGVNNLIANADRGNDSSGTGGTANSALTTGLATNYLAQQLKGPAAASGARVAGDTAATRTWDQNHYGYITNSAATWTAGAPATAIVDKYILFVGLEAAGGANMYAIDYQGSVVDINSSPKTHATLDDATPKFFCVKAVGGDCSVSDWLP